MNTVTESAPDPTLGSGLLVDEVAADMAASRANQLVAELEATFFQLNELMEEVEEGGMPDSQLSSAWTEIKELRVRIVKVSQELNLVSAHRDHMPRVDQKLETSKLVMRNLKRQLAGIESHRENVEKSEKEAQARVEKLKHSTQVASFKRALNEIKTMYANMSQSYSIPATTFTRDQMLKRHKDIPALASEFDVFRERVDRLMQSEVLFPNRELMIDEAVNYMGLLEDGKRKYEKRAYDDLVANDLTENKLKLAESIQIDVEPSVEPSVSVTIFIHLNLNSSKHMLITQPDCLSSI